MSFEKIIFTVLNVTITLQYLLINNDALYERPQNCRSLPMAGLTGLVSYAKVQDKVEGCDGWDAADHIWAGL